MLVDYNIARSRRKNISHVREKYFPHVGKNVAIGKRNMPIFETFLHKTPCLGV